MIGISKKNNRLHFFFLIYFSLLLSGGCFYIFITPVFENFDELAHFSAIKQISYQKIVNNEDSFMDIIYDDNYWPRSYSSGNPPYDNSLVYYKFFQNENLVNQNFKELNLIPNKEFIKGSQINHEYIQHPPFYYFIMAQTLKLFKDFSFLQQILALRFFSYVLALIGIAYGLSGILSLADNTFLFDKNTIIRGFLVYPFIFPMFFVEFSRIGNDSLCLLFVGMIIFFSAKLILNKEILKYSFILGLVLGFGLLTKAFFLPITFVSIFFIVIFIFNKIIEKRKKLLHVIFLLLPVLIVGFPYYFYSYIKSGSFTATGIGMNVAKISINHLDFITLSNAYILLRGLITIPVTFIWGGTQSLVHFNYYFYILPLFLILYILSKIFFILFKFLSFKIIFLMFGVANLIFFIFGLIWAGYYSLVLGNLNANVPGWYLHILFPFLAYMLGLALNSLDSKKIQYLIIYGLVFIIISAWFQITLFSGCSIKDVYKFYFFSKDYYCLTNIYEVFKKLKLIVSPVSAILSLLIFISLTAFVLNKSRNYFIKK